MTILVLGLIILRLYGDSGKENGNYYNGLHRVEGLGLRV